LPVANPRTSLFADYDPAPLNDAGAPPFPGREADEEEDTRGEGIDLELERPQHAWEAIPPGGEPPSDAPVRFIDGSVATKTAGSLLVAYRRRPLIAATVSAAALRLEGRTMRREPGARTKRLLCLYGDGIERDDILQAHRSLQEIGVELMERSAERVPGDFDSLRRATRLLAMEAMEQAERDVMLADVRTPTLVDGLLERRLAATGAHDVPVIGLVKRQMTAYLPPGLQELAYTLKPGERTPAFVLRTVQHVDLVNTYVRLSAQSGASPSYGIVRLTAPLPYVERAHRGDLPAWLSGLAGYLHRLRHRDEAYSRAGISIEPIVRVEDHLHAILPEIDALIPKLHRLLRAGARTEVTA
jgi:hypothetical protein